MSKQERLKAAFEYLKSKGLAHTQKDVASAMGSTSGNVSSAMSGVEKVLTNSFLKRFCEAYSNSISYDWLLTGNGSMLVDGEASTGNRVVVSKMETTINEDVQTVRLPLLPMEALAGGLTCDNEGVTIADCEMYELPLLKAMGARFLIKVSGDSMNPTYRSGDLLACRSVIEPTFIQWGEPYVMDTCQGVIVKRLEPCEEDDEYVLCVSDNPAYKPFRVHRSEIRSFCTIVGFIRAN